MTEVEGENRFCACHKRPENCVTNLSHFSEFNQQKSGKTSKQYNVLPIWGNEQTMNLNPLILANIQGSSYFKGR